MKTLSSGLLVLTLVITSIATCSLQAEVYEVNRSFTDRFSMATATLVGTVDLPVGHYVIQNRAQNPFTAVDLQLTMFANAYSLTYALTDQIHGAGQFIIDATPTTLMFSAIGGGDSANLVFSDSAVYPGNNQYIVGSDQSPAFEAGYTIRGEEVAASAIFPTVFGIVVPEPSSVSLFAVALLGLAFRRRWSKEQR
jgi:hypothetical protein